MGCIKVFYADMHDDEALIEQPLSSLLDGNETAFYPLPMPSGDVTIWLNQGAGDVDPTSGIHAVHEVTRNTPPQVDTSTYRDIRIQRSAMVIGKRWRRALTPLVPQRPLYVSPTKKDGNRSKPGKSKPDEPKTEKPKREGDKGSQRVKRPKREGSASSALRKSRASMV